MKKNILQFVHHLRSKPEETRKHILTIAMIAVAIVLVLVWIATLNLGFDDARKREPLITEQDLKPFELVKQNFTSTIDTVKAGMSGLKDDFMETHTDQQAAAQAASEEPSTPISATGDASMSPTPSNQ